MSTSPILVSCGPWNLHADGFITFVASGVECGYRWRWFSDRRRVMVASGYAPNGVLLWSPLDYEDRYGLAKAYEKYVATLILAPPDGTRESV